MAAPSLSVGMRIGDFVTTKQLGKGSYGVVLLAEDANTGQAVAIKTVKPPETKASSSLVAGDEVKILHELRGHPNITTLHDVLVDPTLPKSMQYQHLVMEYADGGDLLNLLLERKRFSELECRDFFLQILDALCFTHACGVVHRDLKLENVFLNSSGEVKVGDWGFATRYSPYHHIRTTCGSPHYVSPEILLQRPHHGPEGDVWSLGVLLFAIACGSMPFYGTNEQITKRIVSGTYEVAADVSPELKDLIDRIFVLDPEHRITLHEMAVHPWTRGITFQENYLLSHLDLDQPMLMPSALFAEAAHHKTATGALSSAPVSLIAGA